MLCDLCMFMSNNGYVMVFIIMIKINGISGNYIDDQEGQGEWNFDSQFIVGVVGGVVGKLVFYMVDFNVLGNMGLIKVFNKVVIDNIVKIINVLFGWCENDVSVDGMFDVEEVIFIMVVVQGQMFFVFLGDEGVYECNNCGYLDGGNYSVLWLVLLLYVFVIGGIMFYMSGLSFVSESVWNEGLDGNGKFWVMGGGISQILLVLSW